MQARIKLGVITVSAAASIAVPGDTSKAVSTGPVLPPSDRTTVNTEIGRVEISNSAINATIQLPIFTPSIEQWTQIEKRRYKQLVVKFATAALSKVEQGELDRLEAARSRFEDARSTEEILGEFRKRQAYAALIASLKNASIDNA